MSNDIYVKDIHVKWHICQRHTCQMTYMSLAYMSKTYMSKAEGRKEWRRFFIITGIRTYTKTHRIPCIRNFWGRSTSEHGFQFCCPVKLLWYRYRTIFCFQQNYSLIPLWNPHYSLVFPSGTCKNKTNAWHHTYLRPRRGWPSAAAALASDYL